MYFLLKRGDFPLLMLVDQKVSGLQHKSYGPKCWDILSWFCVGINYKNPSSSVHFLLRFRLDDLSQEFGLAFFEDFLSVKREHTHASQGSLEELLFLKAHLNKD